MSSLVAAAEARAAQDASKRGPYLAPFLPSSEIVQRESLRMLELTSDAVLYDIGCGDARLLVEAARQHGCQGIGIDYDEAIVLKARESVAQSGLADAIAILHENALETDLRAAHRIFVYLMPKGMAALRTTFVRILSEGGRIVSYVFSIPDLEPVEKLQPEPMTNLYLYTKDSLPAGESEYRPEEEEEEEEEEENEQQEQEGDRVVRAPQVEQRDGPNTDR
eukprot:scaffold803_cov310-Pinguiococcus_pyrenoidosus.AAC.131